MHPKRPCVIEQVGKQRNGKPRFWCTTHGAGATARYGVRMAECEAAYRDSDDDDLFDLDPSGYPGGIAMWGAVAPIYDTTTLPRDVGIHVHARVLAGKTKEIDRTVGAVRLHYRRDLLEQSTAIIRCETAISYYISRFLGRQIKHLPCTHCGELHLDADFFAVKPHRTHLCHRCGKFFQDERRAVSNPIILLRRECGLEAVDHATVRACRTLDISQADYPGGVQVWASNPAFLWTAKRPEEEGIQIHLFDGVSDSPVEDDTYDAVTIDGVRLDEDMLKHFMAQKALTYLTNKVVSLRCPTCGTPHFDRGDHGFFPHSAHTCETCGGSFPSPGKRRLVVSNPFVETVGRLGELAAK
jgi:hypothetical protein